MQDGGDVYLRNHEGETAGDVLLNAHGLDINQLFRCVRVTISECVRATLYSPLFSIRYARECVRVPTRECVRVLTRECVRATTRECYCECN